MLKLPARQDNATARTITPPGMLALFDHRQSTVSRDRRGRIQTLVSGNAQILEIVYCYFLGHPMAFGPLKQCCYDLSALICCCSNAS